MHDVTLRVGGYEVMHAKDGSALGLRFEIRDSPEVTSVTVPLNPDAAMAVGALLIANADYLSGRPVRNWAALTS